MTNEPIVITREQLTGHIDNPVCTCDSCHPEWHTGVRCNCPTCTDIRAAKAAESERVA